MALCLAVTTNPVISLIRARTGLAGLGTQLHTCVLDGGRCWPRRRASCRMEAQAASHRVAAPDSTLAAHSTNAKNREAANPMIAGGLRSPAVAVTPPAAGRPPDDVTAEPPTGQARGLQSEVIMKNSPSSTAWPVAGLRRWSRGPASPPPSARGSGVTRPL